METLAESVPTAKQKFPGTISSFAAGKISAGKYFLFGRAVPVQYVPLSSKSTNNFTLV